MAVVIYAHSNLHACALKGFASKYATSVQESYPIIKHKCTSVNAGVLDIRHEMGNICAGG